MQVTILQGATAADPPEPSSHNPIAEGSAFALVARTIGAHLAIPAPRDGRPPKDPAPDPGTPHGGADPAALAAAELCTQGPVRATTRHALDTLAGRGDAGPELSPRERPAPRHAPDQPARGWVARRSAAGSALGGPPPRGGFGTPAPGDKPAAQAPPAPTSGPAPAQSASAPAKAPPAGATPIPAGANAARAATPPPAAGTTSGSAPASAAGPRTTGRAPLTVRSHAPAAPRPQPPVEREALVAQIGRGLSAVLRQGGGSLTLRLTPEALGHVRVHMQLAPGRVAASFEVRNESARQLLTDNLPALRAALEAHGLRIAELAVRMDERAEGPQERPPAEQATQENSPDARERRGGEPPSNRRHPAEPEDDPEDAGGAAEPDSVVWPGDGGAVVWHIGLDAIA